MESQVPVGILTTWVIYNLNLFMLQDTSKKWMRLHLLILVIATLRHGKLFEWLFRRVLSSALIFGRFNKSVWGDYSKDIVWYVPFDPFFHCLLDARFNCLPWFYTANYIDLCTPLVVVWVWILAGMSSGSYVL